MGEWDLPITEMTGLLWTQRTFCRPDIPKHVGTCRIGGKCYTISGWVRYTSRGHRIYRLAFKEFDERTHSLPSPL